jgi:hypothetical protein
MKKLLVLTVVAMFSVGSLAIASESRTSDTVAVTKAKKDAKKKEKKATKGHEDAKHEGQAADGHAEGQPAAEEHPAH